MEKQKINIYNEPQNGLDQKDKNVFLGTGFSYEEWKTIKLGQYLLAGSYCLSQRFDNENNALMCFFDIFRPLIVPDKFIQGVNFVGSLGLIFDVVLNYSQLLKKSSNEVMEDFADKLLSNLKQGCLVSGNNINCWVKQNEKGYEHIAKHMFALILAYYDVFEQYLYFYITHNAFFDAQGNYTDNLLFGDDCATRLRDFCRCAFFIDNADTAEGHEVLRNTSFATIALYYNYNFFRDENVPGDTATEEKKIKRSGEFYFALDQFLTDPNTLNDKKPNCDAKEYARLILNAPENCLNDDEREFCKWAKNQIENKDVSDFAQSFFEAYKTQDANKKIMLTKINDLDKLEKGSYVLKKTTDQKGEITFELIKSQDVKELDDVEYFEALISKPYLNYLLHTVPETLNGEEKAFKNFFLREATKDSSPVSRIKITGGDTVFTNWQNKTKKIDKLKIFGNFQKAKKRFLELKKKVGKRYPLDEETLNSKIKKVNEEYQKNLEFMNSYEGIFFNDEKKEYDYDDILKFKRFKEKISPKKANENFLFWTVIIFSIVGVATGWGAFLAGISATIISIGSCGVFVPFEILLVSIFNPTTEIKAAKDFYSKQKSLVLKNNEKISNEKNLPERNLQNLKNLQNLEQK